MNSPSCLVPIRNLQTASPTAEFELVKPRPKMEWWISPDICVGNLEPDSVGKPSCLINIIKMRGGPCTGIILTSKDISASVWWLLDYRDIGRIDSEP